MLNYELQLAILNELAVTYLDEKRIEITSKQFGVDQHSFALNLTYLKREKLIDLSSLSSRAAVVVEPNVEAASSKTLSTDAYTLARCVITHTGLKALSTSKNIKFVE
jgi:hypothetical protein